MYGRVKEAIQWLLEAGASLEARCSGVEVFAGSRWTGVCYVKLFGLSINTKLLFYQTYLCQTFWLKNSIILCSLRFLKLCLQQIPRNSKPCIYRSFLIDRTPNGIIFQRRCVRMPIQKFERVQPRYWPKGRWGKTPAVRLQGRVVSDAFQVVDLQPFMKTQTLRFVPEVLATDVF